MKRLLANTIILLLAFVVVACSSNSDTGNEQPSSTDDGANEGNEELVTINYYTWESGALEETINKKIENFERDNPNIKVEYEALVPSNDTLEYYQQLDILTGTGQAIDVVAFSHVDFLVERAARGVLTPLDEFFQEDNISPDDEFYIVPEYEGSTYGVQDLSQPWFVAINRDSLDAANLPIPEWGWTWEDFHEYAKALTTETQYGAYFHTWGEFAGLPAYSELAHPYLTEEEAAVFNHEVFTDFFELRREMEQSGSVKTFQDTIAGNLHYASEYFSGETAMLPIGSFFIPLLKDDFEGDFQTVIVPLPRSSEAVEVGATYTGGHYLAVGNTSDYKEEAYKFALYMAQQTEVITDFPGSRNVDQDEVIELMIGDAEDIIHRDSLTNTVFNENVYIPYNPNYSTAYASQLKSILEDGFSRYILDGENVETVQEWMVERVSEVKAREE
ncbi:ABC transporter substrate-binding protein [Alkalihalobacillus sp. 1P02AB]|uniref:ABC transporter substrate-binding protein n=1 Tax=Alkalihalobacillus sp. 1P02AB TaxID=3132260 RepID=UPI0039A5578D